MRYVPDPILALYRATPVWTRTLASSLYGVLKNRRELTPEFREALDDLTVAEWYAAERLKELQSDRLRRLIRHAAVNVPYYGKAFADHGVIVSQIQGPDDLRRLPTLTKETIRSRSEELLARGYDRKALRSESTSGSSGMPLTVWMDEPAYAYTKAVQWLQHGWAGYTHREWIGILAGYRVVPVGRERPPFWISNHAGHQIHFSTYHLKPRFMGAMVRKLKESRIHFLLGYPSAIGLLARHVVEMGETLPMKAIFPSSEPIYRWQADAIERAFGSPPLYNYYGQGEKVVSATGCGRSMAMHVNMEMCVAELVDPPSPGPHRYLVGTPLFNYAMPLIRYELNDLTTGVPEPCPCGRAHVRIGPVETLSNHYLVSPDGSWISPSVLYLAFTELRGISGAQVIQQDLRTIEVHIVRGEGFTDQEARKLTGNLRAMLGDQFSVALLPVPEIPQSANGKSRFVVSKVYLERREALEHTRE